MPLTGRYPQDYPDVSSGLSMGCSTPPWGGGVVIYRLSAASRVPFAGLPYTYCRAPYEMVTPNVIMETADSPLYVAMVSSREG